MFKLITNSDTFKTYVQQNTEGVYIKPKDVYLFDNSEHFSDELSTFFSNNHSINYVPAGITLSIEEMKLIKDTFYRIILCKHNRSTKVELDLDKFFEENLYYILNNHIKPLRYDETSIEKCLFASVESDGSISILYKNSDLLGSFSYNDQELAIAYLVHKNPDIINVYDPGDLLKQDLVISLKILLGERVEFYDEGYPVNYYESKKG